MSQKIPSPNSSIDQSEQLNHRAEINGNITIVNKPLNSILKSTLEGDKKGNQQKFKVLRFAQPVKQIFIVENWKKHNQILEEEKETCCLIF